MINGKLYDWEDVHIILPGGVAIGITEINYADEKGLEARYGKGAVPRGYGRKNYKASGSMTLDRDQFEMLRVMLKGSVYNNIPFPIISSYANDDMPTVIDVLPNVLITKTDTSAKQDSDNVSQMKLDFTILSPIRWNGVSAQ